jgi:hypothetical protein
VRVPRTPCGQAAVRTRGGGRRVVVAGGGWQRSARCTVHSMVWPHCKSERVTRTTKDDQRNAHHAMASLEVSHSSMTRLD